nr:E3 ubiquitin-protein ligase TRIM41-like [Pogona vitticeps]
MYTHVVANFECPATVCKRIPLSSPRPRAPPSNENRNRTWWSRERRQKQGAAWARVGRTPVSLREEYLCAICLEPFRNPVTLDCGHNFCQGCLARCRGEGGHREARYPQCREPVPPRRFRPNWQLASIIQAVLELELEKRAWERGWGKCPKHPVAPTRFCREDEALLCSVCQRAQEHQSHRVVPVEDVAPEYQARGYLSYRDLRTLFPDPISSSLLRKTWYFQSAIEWK